MKLRDTVYYNEQKYRVIGKPLHGFTHPQCIDLLLYGVFLHDYSPEYRKRVYASEVSLHPPPAQPVLEPFTPYLVRARA